MGLNKLDDRESIGDETGHEIDNQRPLADGFRVRVSLKRFFTDERERVLVWAERAQPAAWLLRRLRAALPLPPARLALFTAGHLLLPAEPLALLRPDDLLEVIISPSADGRVSDVGDTPAAREAARDARRDVDTSGEGEREGEGGELVAVKRRALRLLDELEGGGEPAPRRRRRTRRRRPASGADGATGADGAKPALWRAEDAGVVRSATPPRTARLVSAAH